MTRFAQPSGGEDDPVALAFCRKTDVLEVGFVVARARVRENADKSSAVPKVFGYGQKFRGLGSEPRTVAVDVHFEENRNRHAVFPTEVRNGVRRGGVVENDLEVAPAFT